MNPRLHVISSDNRQLNQIIDVISDFDCAPFFQRHLGLPQSDQKKIVDEFQNELFSYLKSILNKTLWDTDYSPSDNSRDTIDIVGFNNDSTIVIELDKHRADQVAKKFISRTALLVDKKLIYIALCYPGTNRMNPNECIKYFTYCKCISKKLGNEYAGYITE